MKDTYTSKIKIRLRDGSLVDWETLSEAEKREIGIQLNRQGMEAVGFRAVKPDQTAQSGQKGQAMRKSRDVRRMIKLMKKIEKRLRRKG